MEYVDTPPEVKGEEAVVLKGSEDRYSKLQIYFLRRLNYLLRLRQLNRDPPVPPGRLPLPEKLTTGSRLAAARRRLGDAACADGPREPRTPLRQPPGRGASP